ncbi:MAG: hypothetical protein ACTHJ8_09195 [Mucilaginibacter sp.]
MKKILAFILSIALFQSCSVVSKQYFYVPSAEHQVTKDKEGYFTVLHITAQVRDSLGNSIGQVRTSSNLGIPLLAGPPYVPVLPVGIVTVFAKNLHRFKMDIVVRDDNGLFTCVPVDTARVNAIIHPSKDSYRPSPVLIDTGKSYVIVNGIKKVPAKIVEFFDPNGNGYGYRITADISFSKVRTVTIITGNASLNPKLDHLVFKRRKRLSYSVIGFS